MDKETGADQEKDLSAGLHLVATPIGNMGDLSPRARQTLARADLVACEDTRLTGRMLRTIGIATPLARYDDHSGDSERDRLVDRIRAGAAVALVSDAGTPAISDPGYKLVRAVLDEGLALHTVPGPNAALTALVLSGLPTDRFYFGGFPPTKAGARQRFLQGLVSIPATLILYEGPSRSGRSLADMAQILGDRPAAVARELTKRFEEVRRDRLSRLAEHYATRAPRGEVTIVIGPPEDNTPVEQHLDAALREALAEHGPSEAARRVARSLGIGRRTVYQRALMLAAERTDGDEA